MMWVLSSKIGRAFSAIVGVLLAFVTFGAYKERKGAKKGADRVSRSAMVAAEKRRETRRVIEGVNDVDAARDRLRDSWAD